MTARTILEHTDDILALPAGAWLIVTAPIWGTPDEGGRVDIPIGTHLRIACSLGEYLTAHTADARSMTIRRDQLAHVERLLRPVRQGGQADG